MVRVHSIQPKALIRVLFLFSRVLMRVATHAPASLEPPFGADASFSQINLLHFAIKRVHSIQPKALKASAFIFLFVSLDGKAVRAYGARTTFRC